LRRLEGKHNIIPILYNYVNPIQGTCAIIMPYIKHKPFSEYFNKLTVNQTRKYIHGLLTSLAHLHRLGILHRDIKPPNFLFDPETSIARLVDFGLSEDITTKDLRLSNTMNFNNPACFCNHMELCSICSTKRRSMKASRAGTGGFRPPEVLLKSHRQDQKIDVWAAGVCLLILLSRRYPYFPATDDTVALTHIGELLGLAGLREAATSLGRKLSIQGLKETSFTVQQIVRKQRNSSKHPIETDDTRGQEWREVTDLLIRLLQPNPKNRPNAGQALNMDFFVNYAL
jgi:cell division control protein 7